VRLNNMLCYGKPVTGSQACTRSICLVKPLKNAVPVFRGNAYAGIADRNLDLLALELRIC